MARNTSAATAPQGWMGRSAGLSDRAIRLLREARWISLCFLALFLFLVLVSYDPRDPGWSHAVLARADRQPGGQGRRLDRRLHAVPVRPVGLPVLGLPDDAGASRATGHCIAIRPKSRSPSLTRFAWERWVGFVIMLDRLHRHRSGPALQRSMRPCRLAPGGLLGALVSQPVHEQLGAVGGTLALAADDRRRLQPRERRLVADRVRADRRRCSRRRLRG